MIGIWSCGTARGRRRKQDIKNNRSEEERKKGRKKRRKKGEKRRRNGRDYNNTVVNAAFLQIVFITLLTMRTGR